MVHCMLHLLQSELFFYYSIEGIIKIDNLRIHEYSRVEFWQTLEMSFYQHRKMPLQKCFRYTVKPSKISEIGVGE